MVSEIKADKLTNQSGDQDTSVDLSTNDVVKVNIAGSEKVRVDANGNVGIGTASPTHTLEIDVNDDTQDGYKQLKLVGGRPTIFMRENNGSANENFQLRVDSGSFLIQQQDDAQNSASTKMSVDQSGRVKIGTTSTLSTAVAEMLAVDAGTSGGYPAVFASNTSGGFACVFLKTGSNVSNLMLFRRDSTQVGSITTNGSATAFNESSDYRLKENVVTDWDATSRLKQLKPSRFNFKADKDTTVDGFLAHEVSSVVPEAVTGEKDAVEVWEKEEKLPDGVSVGDNKLDDDGNTIPIIQQIDKSKLVPLLVKTIQELEARIAALEAK